MHIHLEKKLCYLAHPRTASVATVAALQSVGFESRGHHTGLRDLSPAQIKELLIFTTVRNPFDSAVSWTYHMHLRADPPLPEPPWGREIFDAGIGEKNSWIRDYGKLFWMYDDADLVLSYENLQEELDELLVSFDLPAVDIPRKNVSTPRAGRPYRDFYRDQEAIDYVAARLAGELDDLDYRFEDAGRGRRRLKLARKPRRERNAA